MRYYNIKGALMDISRKIIVTWFPLKFPWYTWMNVINVFFFLSCVDGLCYYSLFPYINVCGSIIFISSLGGLWVVIDPFLIFPISSRPWGYALLVSFGTWGFPLGVCEGKRGFALLYSESISLMYEQTRKCLYLWFTNKAQKNMIFLKMFCSISYHL